MLLSLVKNVDGYLSLIRPGDICGISKFLLAGEAWGSHQPALPHPLPQKDPEFRRIPYP